jgi:hypothetical protein
MSDKPGVPFAVGDHVRIKTDGFHINWGSLSPMNRAGSHTGRVVKVINRHRYYIQWDEPLTLAYGDSSLEKLQD